MRKVKVMIKTFNQERFFGWLYVQDNERAQDLINDDRKFLPVMKSQDDRGRRDDSDILTHVLINKDAVAIIEEI